MTVYTFKRLRSLGVFFELYYSFDNLFRIDSAIYLLMKFTFTFYVIGAAAMDQ